MTQQNENLISLNELAKELNLNKSKLSYYVRHGLLNPISTVGRMGIFDKTKTTEIIKKIKEEQKNGKTLDEIKGLLED